MMFFWINNIKFACSIAASLLAIFGGYLPYIKDIFSGKTKPHIYTWLIWAITQGVALAGLVYGNGGWGILSISVGLFFVVLIFLLSLKYGTKNISVFDKAVLVASFLSIIIWIQMKNPFWAVLMVSTIYFLGYIPSFRKTFNDPWSETLLSWVIFFIGNILILLSLAEYNFLTLIYTLTITISNGIIIAICLTRRPALIKN